MANAERTAASRRRRNAYLAVLCPALAAFGNVAIADVAPIEQSGYLEYQFRTNITEDGPGSEQHLVTWRGDGSTFVWQPYILLLDGDIGLTRAFTSNSKNKTKSTIVTGSIIADAFSRSTFPLRLYFQQSDSRVNGDVFDSDFTTRNWGFMQQLVSKRKGRSVSLEYRASDTDEITVNGRTEQRNFGSELWQLTGTQALGRNDFRLVTSSRKLERSAPSQTRDRILFNLRHQFRSSSRFNVEDTLFYSDEQINLRNGEQFRRFLQFNGFSNWRPDTARPLTVIGRVLARTVESGNGTSVGSQNYLLSGSATYQYSPQLTLAASAGVDGSQGDNFASRTSTFQRMRGTYRGRMLDWGWSSYNWGGSVELANRSVRNDDENSGQAGSVSFNHGLSRAASLGGGKQIQLSLTQAASATADTFDRRWQALVHTATATYSRQRGRTSGYLRFSASDRRLFGNRREEYQLFSLQGSSRMQINRTRSLNGSFSLQYSNSASPMRLNGDLDEMPMRDTGTLTYSVNLSYADRQLFDVLNLSFLSELRYLSSEFRDDDEFSRDFEFDPERSDSSWRNELTYRIGLLELSLLTAMREFNGRWSGQAFFSIRRYYGSI